MRSRAALLTVLLLALPVLAAPQVDVATLGPQVGARAIAFRLPDQHGHPRTLATVAGPAGTMLVFFRSADW
jgi:hypothetical protein